MNFCFFTLFPSSITELSQMNLVSQTHFCYIGRITTHT
ncbi:hypothetical protein R103_D20841 [Saccharomyces cerevisiae R103]|uniref:Putative uncharacterized protein YDL114W-A n=2 Tax=Saccharomyces cerevisiae TaxID=4932 RepID=YDL14_YEAST|nr:RecName: Full=Putative uncharacterized protein YDL114W-A [Saccharomyces cerevisiae S288C]EWG96892.1 hypothetical protein R103_D20841 [Saccharomyces cerevisiae R103]KZV12114.1 hypothetical protein WN66_00928 [Saccharomyces cerevisiae]CAY78394.1 EC1118_1D0_1068p [Saccharomyces cerevisiae EC1118]